METGHDVKRQNTRQTKKSIDCNNKSMDYNNKLADCNNKSIKTQQKTNSQKQGSKPESTNTNDIAIMNSNVPITTNTTSTINNQTQFVNTKPIIKKRTASKISSDSKGVLESKTTIKTNNNKTYSNNKTIQTKQPKQSKQPKHNDQSKQVKLAKKTKNTKNIKNVRNIKKDNESDEPIETDHSSNNTNDTDTNTSSTDDDNDDIMINNIKSDNTDNTNSTSVSSYKSKLLEDYNIDDEKRKDNEEEILKDTHFRLAIKPIDPNYQIIWNLYKKQHEAHWTAEEIDFSDDRHDFQKLDGNIQHFIKRILAFFAGADSIVNMNIREKFSKITIKEAEVAYGFQQMMENIHGEVYADMLINIITDPKERDDLMNAFKNVNSIKKMIQWAQHWIESDRRIGFSIVVFSIFEGLMFSGAFAAIYWLKKILGEDKMKGLTQSNNLIAKDEGMHTNFGCVMYDYVIHRLTQEEINILIHESVVICKEFTNDAIRVDMIGMNVNLMHRYIEYVADRLVVYLGYDKIFNTPIPDSLQFMDLIGFLNKDNFFERRSTEYQKAYNDRNKANWDFKILKVY